MLNKKNNADAIDCRLAVSDSIVGELPVHIACREHKEEAKSLVIYRDRLLCEVCRFHIDEADDALAYLFNISWQELKAKDENGNCIRDRYKQSSVDANREKASQEARNNPLPLIFAKSYQYILSTSRLRRKEWLYDRGLNEQTIYNNFIGHTGDAFTFPFFDKNHNLISFRYCRDDYFGVKDQEGREIARYWGMTGRNGLYLYGEHWLATDDKDYVILTEGELDALRLRQEGLPAISVTSGAGNLKRVPELLVDFPRIKKIIIASDMNERGDVAAEELIASCNEHGLLYKRLTWPREHKNITGLYCAGGSIKEYGYEE